MRKSVLSIAASIALIMSACGGSSNVKTSDSAGADEVVKKESVSESASGKMLAANGNPVILDFSAEWCPPCRKLKPIFAELKKEYEGKVDFVTINVDSMPDLSREYGIESIPALVYLDASGKEIYRAVGFQTAEQIRSDISKTFK